jgi:hypothetical protein
MPEVRYAIPSFKRTGKVRTLQVIPKAQVWVPQSQAKAYANAHGADNVVSIPDELDGNVSRKRNAILDRLSGEEWVVLLDDDLTGIWRREANERTRLTAAEIDWLCHEQFLLCETIGVRMWGLNQNQDPLAYRVAHPFGMLAPILGPFVGLLRPDLRYDESCAMKEDYDYWLQHIARDHRTWRVNKYHYTHDHAKMAGGCQATRTMKMEQRATERMVAKWGADVVQVGANRGANRRSEGNILNTRLRVPIAGM